MKERRMRGQFFLITVFMLIIIFYGGISVYLSPPSFSGDLPADIDYIARNIENEYPVAFNLGLNESSGVDSVVSFTLFARDILMERDMDFYSLIVFSQSSGDDVNVTVGNFLGNPEWVSVGISGDDRLLYVGNGSVNSTLFPDPAETFKLDVIFNSEQKNLLLGKYKSSLYIYTEVRKGNDVIIGERIA